MSIEQLFNEFLETVPTLKDVNTTWKGIQKLLLYNVTREKKEALEAIQENGMAYCNMYEHGQDIIRDYYKYKFDIIELHNKLEKLFGSKQKAFIFLEDNDKKIKQDILGC